MLEFVGTPVINREDYNLRDLSEYDPSWRGVGRASFGSNFAMNPATQAAEIGTVNSLQAGDSYYVDEMGNQQTVKRLDPEDPGARRMSLDEANQQGEALGLRFSEPPTKAQFDYFSQQKQAENGREETLSRVPTLSIRSGVSLAAGFAASAVDPVNLATAFIPVIGEARYGRMIERMGTHSARLAKGAAEGGVGTALVVPAIAYQADILHQDYGLSGAFQDLVFGTGLGAGLHWGGGAIGDVIRARANANTARLLREASPPSTPPAGGGPATTPLDRRKVRVQEGENTSIVESMDRNTRTEVLRAAVKAVETDTVPKVDEILKTAPELGNMAVPDKRFPATVRLRNDITASDFATGTNGAHTLNHVAEQIAGRKGATPQNLFDTFAARYKKLQDFSLKAVSKEEFQAQTQGLLEHPDQRAAVDPGSKTILVAPDAPLGAVRHEIERAIDQAYGETGDKAGGYRYRAKDGETQVGHRAAHREHYDEFPDRSPQRASPREAVDLFSKRDEPILGHQGPADADEAWQVVEKGKDLDLETRIKDEEIAVVEDIAQNITGAARDLGIMDKVIPMEERLVLEQAAANQGKQKAMKDLFTATDAAVERNVGTQALEDAEILITGGADTLKAVILEGKSVKQVVADVRAEKPELVTRAEALRSINLFQRKTDTPLTGAALDRAIRAIQDGEDINVAVQGAGLLARADEASEAPAGAAAGFEAPGEDKAVPTEEDIFGDIEAEAGDILDGIISKRELAEAEARLIRDEHDELERDPKTADLASSIERTEFDEAQRDRAFREGSGTLSGGERARARSGSAGQPLEEGLFAARTSRDGEAVRGQGAAAERERVTAGGERAAPETTISYGAGAIPRRIITPDSSIEVSVEPKFVELSDLIHATGDLQVRDRARKESEAEALERALKLDPEQLMPNRVADAGSPIVIGDGTGKYTIVSGNGRVLSLRKVYGDETLTWKANQYRDRLGPAADGYRRPVLVMNITDQMSHEQLVKFAERANRSRIAEMSITEKAQRDADSAGIDLMMLYQGGDFSKKENQPFLRAFMRKVATAQELGEMSKNGVLTKTGVDRLNAAVMASAYDDTGVLSLMLESTDNNIKSISAAYRDAAPVFMKLRAEIAQGLVREEMDITPFMMEAARFVQEARDSGVKIANALAQVDAFHPMDPMVDRLIRQFYNPELTRANSALRISENLRIYAEAAREKRLGGFFEDNTTTLDVMDAAERRFAREADETLLAPDEADNGASPAGAGGEVPQPAPEGPRQVAGERGQDAGAAEAARPTTEAGQGVVSETKGQMEKRVAAMSVPERIQHLKDLAEKWESRRDRLGSYTQYTHTLDEAGNITGRKQDLTGLLKALDEAKRDSDESMEITYHHRGVDDPAHPEQGRPDSGVIQRAWSDLLGAVDKMKGSPAGKKLIEAAETKMAASEAAPEVAAASLSSWRSTLNREGEAALRAKLEAMKLPELRAERERQKIAGKGRSKEQVITQIIEGVKAARDDRMAAAGGHDPSADRRALNPEERATQLRPEPTYKDQIKQAGWADVINDQDGSFKLLREDGASVVKRMEGKDKTITERLIKKSHEVEASVRALQWDEAQETLGDMVDDAARLSGDTKAKLVKQWVDNAARHRHIPTTRELEAGAEKPTTREQMHPRREAFYDYLEGREPVKSAANIAKQMGIKQEDAYKLLDEAVDRGWLKINAMDLYIRVPVKERGPRPGLDEIPSPMGDLVSLNRRASDQERFDALVDKRSEIYSKIDDLRIELSKLREVPDSDPRLDVLYGKIDAALAEVERFSDEIGAISDRLEARDRAINSARWRSMELQDAWHTADSIRTEIEQVRENLDIARGDSSFAGRRQVQLMNDQLAKLSRDLRAADVEYQRIQDEVDRTIDLPSFILNNPELVKLHAELSNFVESGRPNAWIYGDGDSFSLYVRNTKRRGEGGLERSLDIASVEVAKKGEGSFKQMLDTIEEVALLKGFDMLYVENVQTDRFADYFRKTGWKEEPRRDRMEEPSFSKRFGLDADDFDTARPPRGWDSIEGGKEAAVIERELQSHLAIQRVIGQALHRVPDLIKFEVMENFGLGTITSAAGAYIPSKHLIALSKYMSRGPVETINHEIFHALRHIKLFTSYEWGIVRATYESAMGIDPARKAQYNTYYRTEIAKRGLNLDPEWLKDKMAEEWAATAFGEWSEKRGSERETAMGRLWGRTKDFLSDLSKSFEGLARRAILGEDATKVVTAIDIFKAIEDGTIAKRWEEWGAGKGDGSNPMSSKSMAVDDTTKMLNDRMRENAHDDSGSKARVIEQVLNALAPCATYNL